MTQDSPATDAGTDAGPDRVLRDILRRAVEVDGIVSLDLEGFTTLKSFAEHRIAERTTPDTWAPINRREMRDDVDRFRNERMPVPVARFEAMALAALALEYFEHAHEVATRTSKALDEMNDDYLEAIAMVPPPEPGCVYDRLKGERRRLAAKMDEANKELAVATRRHATALAYLNTFKGE